MQNLAGSCWRRWSKPNRGYWVRIILVPFLA
jgi:hypothetical protein